MSAFAPNAFLTAPVWNWGPRYVEIINDAKAGNYSPSAYWGSMAEGIVDLAPIASDVDQSVVDMVMGESGNHRRRHASIHWSYKRSDGNQVLGAGEVMDDDQCSA